jgi:hypothetical protein
MKSVVRFRNMRTSPLNPGIFRQQHFLPADVEMANIEDPMPKKPSTDVMTISLNF